MRQSTRGWLQPCPWIVVLVLWVAFSWPSDAFLHIRQRRFSRKQTKLAHRAVAQDSLTRSWQKRKPSRWDTSLKSSLPFANPDRCKEWRQEALAIGASVVALWTGLDCALDPGVRPLEDPIGLLKIALPTALLVAPGAAVAACARLKPTPADFKGPAGVVMVGDSLTQGTVSANVLEVLAERGRRRGQTLGSLVNGGLNFRALSDVGPELLQRAADLKPSHGLVLQLGSNDLIRYLAAPEWLRPAEEEWLQTYAEQMRQAALELRCGGEVLLVSPPPLGEALGSLEFDLGAKMAKAVEAVAADVGCGYVPLFEACVKFLQRSREVDSSAGTRGYSLAEFLPRLCLLPWRLYVGQQSLSQIQAEEETKLTLDLVHFGDSYAQLAADLLEEKLGLLK